MRTSEARAVIRLSRESSLKAFKAYQKLKTFR